MKHDSMLTKLMRSLGGSAEATAPDEAVAALQTEFDAYKQSVQEELAQMSSALETAVNAVKEADAKVAELQAALDAVADEQAKALAAAEQARLDARKQAIEAAVGTGRTDALMTATSALDDAAFNAVLSALTLSVDAESKSAMFTEKGVAAEVDAGSVVTETAEAKALRQKYGAAK